MTVIQTGAIAAVAFVFGDYASEIFACRGKLGLWAAIAVVVLTLLNLAGTLQSKLTQKIMEAALISAWWCSRSPRCSSAARRPRRRRRQAARSRRSASR